MNRQATFGQSNPESFLWVVGMHLDRIGVAITMGRAIGDEVLHLWALTRHVVEKDNGFRKEWKDLKDRIDAYVKQSGADPDGDATVPMRFRIEQEAAIIGALVRRGAYYTPALPDRSSADDSRPSEEKEIEAE